MLLGRLLVGAVFVAGSIGCAEPTGVVERDALRAETSSGQLRLENIGTERFYYAVFEREILARISWGASVNAPAKSIEPGTSVTIPYAAIFGYELGKQEAVVFWWIRADANADGWVPPDKIASVVVGL